MSTDWLVQTLAESLNKVFATYQPKYADTTISIDASLTELLKVPDDYWNLEPERATPADIQLGEFVETQVNTILSALGNSLLATFNIDGYAGLSNNFVGIAGNEAATQAAIESSAEEASWNKFHTVVSLLTWKSATEELMLTYALFCLISSSLPLPVPASP